MIERVWNGPVPAIRRSESRVIRLRRPLGDRRVVDADTGGTVRRLRYAALRDCFRQLEER